MQSKKARQPRPRNDTKENIHNNGHHTSAAHGLRKLAKKALGTSVEPLSENNCSKSPQDIRDMIRAQQSTIFNEFGHCGLLDCEFYKVVEEKLGNSKICARIMQIRNMSNEEALEEFMKVQRNQQVYHSYSPNQMDRQEQIFPEYGNSIMLEDYDHLSFKEFNHNYDMQEDDQMEEESRLGGGHPLWTAHELNYDIFEF